MTFPAIPVISAPQKLKAGDRVRIGLSPYVFYVHTFDPNWVWLNVPGMTGKFFAVAPDCVESVEQEG